MKLILQLPCLSLIMSMALGSQLVPEEVSLKTQLVSLRRRLLHHLRPSTKALPSIPSRSTNIEAAGLVVSGLRWRGQHGVRIGTDIIVFLKKFPPKLSVMC
ncbi:uncharacterized protein LOC129315698 [Prosopis cineraria]|uniref:uncharacterized protein LOC129315698 n=1 Tax=Prosopis cineraria TaxID=364024 RepID=UPI00240F0892|nr:uncharacterized protein LOC129315698 [Prosopis cineraria]